MDWVKSPFRQRMVAALVVPLGGGLLTPLVMQLPLLDHDWQTCFEARDSVLLPDDEGDDRYPSGAHYDQYPPWTYRMLRPLGCSGS